MTREEIAERMRTDALRVTADYHREHERYGGASREMHARALTAIEDVRALADAVRALPVIATCRQCARYDVLPATDLRGIQGWCGAKRQQVDARGSVPPWCPLRGGER